jgi:hypothetical protein
MSSDEINPSNMTDIKINEIEPGLWRASIRGADHCGGTGFSPAEAIGFLCFNHPQRMGIIQFSWAKEPPKLPSHPVELYPSGFQSPFETIP